MTRMWRLVVALVAMLATNLIVMAPAHAKFLEPEQAFQFSARPTDANTIEIKYRIADGYYLYRERFKFALDPAASGNAKLGEPILPKGEIKFDETFNKDVEHYRNEVVVRIPVEGATGPITLLSTSQGCADAGLCYPPQVAKAVLTTTSASASRASGGDVAKSAPALDDASRIERTLKSGNLGWIVLLFIGLGLLLAFTPCMLPMLPILSSIIVGQAGPERVTTRAGGLALASAYSLGMALIYTLLGVAAGLAGEGLAAALQTPLILGTFAVLLVLFALSMFGFYELQVPASVQARLARWSSKVGTPSNEAGRRLSVGRLAGVFAMGSMSALIVGPCVAAPLAGALLYISQTRDVVIGGLALFSLAVGMSVPLLLVGLSAGSLLPRVGAWMETVEHFFGVLLIAVAMWMVTPILPTWIVMLAWAALAIIAAVYLRVFDALDPNASGFARLAKGIGVLLLLAGAVEFVGLATGGRDVLQPLGHIAQRGSNASTTTSAPATPFERVKSGADLDRRIATADKPVLLDFYADWCVSCKEMERFTYTDARVASRMQDFVLLQADVTANDDDDRALLKRFQLFGPPGIIFFDRAGKQLTDAGVIGFQDAERFLSSLTAVDQTGGS
jgi:thiol:disulfide interchange protein DsbD